MNNRAEYILAIDHGTSGVKVALVTSLGKVIDFEFEATPTYYPGGGIEQDPEEWWQAFLKSAKRLLNRNYNLRYSIIAIGVSSTFSSTVAVDADGNHLMNCLTWMDSRGAPYVRDLIGGFPAIEGYNLFKGLQWIKITGGAPQLSGKDDIAHVLFIKNMYPNIYEKTYKFLPSKDYLNLRLSGRFAASHDSVMLFWCTDIRDIDNIKYSDKLLAKCGVHKDKLPELKRSIDVLGPIKNELAEELGLKKDLQVVMGSPDHQAALLGSGATRNYEGHMYIGTSSWMECVVPCKKIDPWHSITALPSSIPGKYQCINEQDIAGGCLSFLLNNIILHDNEFFIGKEEGDPYKKLNTMAGRVPPGSGNLIFTPWLNGERTPVDNITIRGGLHNISLNTTADHIARAVLEGVAYNTRWNLGYVEKFIKRPFQGLNFIGGGANSELWCQIFADVTGRQIRRVLDPVQANARGAAFIAAVALDRISFDDIPDLVELDKYFDPDTDRYSFYQEMFEEFLQIYQKNKHIYKRLNS